MWKYYIIAIAGIPIWFGATTQATIISVDYDDESVNPSRAVRSVSFDYDILELTITETVYDLDYRGPLDILSWADSECQFGVTKTLVNNTGVTWTGFLFTWGGAAYWRQSRTTRHGFSNEHKASDNYACHR